MQKRRFLGFSPSIWSIGLMALLLNISTVIIFSLQPVYLVEVMGVSKSRLGRVEGAVEFLSWATRVFSGSLSDMLRRRKPLLLVAMGLTVLARTGFAIASSVTAVFVSRSADRVANGLQASPRDALIGDLSQGGHQERNYGLRQSLGTAGSAIGAILAFYLVTLGGITYQSIFFLAALFPILALIIVMIGVKDPQHVTPQKNSQKKRHALRKTLRSFIRDLRHLNQRFWAVMLVAACYMATQYSSSFTILRAGEVFSTKAAGPVIMIAQNIAAAFIAYPVARLCENVSPYRMLSVGLLLVLASNLIFFTVTESKTTIILGAMLWGAQLGIVHPLLAVKVSKSTSVENRGTGFGVYYIVAGLATFASTSFMGMLSDLYGLKGAMLFPCVIAIIGIFALAFVGKKMQQDTQK